MRAVIAIAMIVALLPASAIAAEPTNYCTAVTVVPPQNTGEPYTITVAAGSGSYWRVREYTAGSVVIPAVYDPTVPVTLVGVLTAGVEYQVQAAHSAGGPWSTGGCRFVAESALGAYFEYALIHQNGVLEWLAIQEPLYFQWFWGDPEASDGWVPVTPVIPSPRPLGLGIVQFAKPDTYFDSGDYMICGYHFFGSAITDCEIAQRAGAP